MAGVSDARSEHPPELQEIPNLNNYRYDRSQLLGKGGNGAVYRGYKTDELAGQRSKYAVKILSYPSSLETVEGDTEWLRREATFLQELQSKHVVKYYAHSVVKNHVSATNSVSVRVYVIMEFCSGGDVFDHAQVLARRGYNEEDVVAMCGYQMLQAIRFVHSRNIMHRDLKPSNFLVSEDGIIKLADFGTSKVFKDHQSGGQTHVGTPQYMAPEIQARAHHGFSVDLFSFGMSIYTLCYALCRLKVPKPDRTGVCLPKAYSIDIQNLVESLLEKHPESRLTAEQLTGDRVIVKGRALLFTLQQKTLQQKLEMKSHELQEHLLAVTLRIKSQTIPPPGPHEQKQDLHVRAADYPLSILISPIITAKHAFDTTLEAFAKVGIIPFAIQFLRPLTTDSTCITFNSPQDRDIALRFLKERGLSLPYQFRVLLPGKRHADQLPKSYLDAQLAMPQESRRIQFAERKECQDDSVSTLFIIPSGLNVNVVWPEPDDPNPHVNVFKEFAVVPTSDCEERTYSGKALPPDPLRSYSKEFDLYLQRRTLVEEQLKSGQGLRRKRE